MELVKSLKQKDDLYEVYQSLSEARTSRLLSSSDTIGKLINRHMKKIESELGKSQEQIFEAVTKKRMEASAAIDSASHPSRGVIYSNSISGNSRSSVSQTGISTTVNDNEQEISVSSTRRSSR